MLSFMWCFFIVRKRFLRFYVCVLGFVFCVHARVLRLVLCSVEIFAACFQPRVLVTYYACAIFVRVTTPHALLVPAYG